MLINGRIVSGLGDVLEIFDPAKGEIITRLRAASEDQVSEAVRAAEMAFPAWRAKSPAERAAALGEVARSIEERGEELARIESRNVGKPYRAALQDEIPQIADCFRFYAGAARTAGGMAAGEYVANSTSFVRRDPIGVVGCIVPWNYPLMMAAWKLAPALAAGNTVVLKPSELTPLSVAALLEVFGASLPPGVVNVVYGCGIPIGSAIAGHPGVRMVSLTGSVAAGRAVLSNAAGSIKRTHLELGGNAPVLVFADADLDALAACIRSAGFYNAGQDCTAACRVYAERKIYADVVASLGAEVKRITVGDPSELGTEMGPLISHAHRERVHGFVSRTLSLGHTRLIAGGEKRGGVGWFYAPTLIADVRPEDEIVREEVFGPVVTVTPVNGEDQAIAYANDVHQGLASSLWTRDVGRAFRVIPRIEAGVTWVNSHFTYTSEMPHGGVKQSGYGSDLSIYGIEAYSQVRHVMIAHEAAQQEGRPIA